LLTCWFRSLAVNYRVSTSEEKQTKENKGNSEHIKVQLHIQKMSFRLKRYFLTRSPGNN
jgi:hypothetical protein